MPLYEYQCKQCQHRFEKIQSFSAPEEKVCPECGGEVERWISTPAIQFKGAGWYVNDYAGRGKAPPSGGPGGSKDVSASGADGSPKGESGKSDGAKSDSSSKSNRDGRTDSGAASTKSESSAASSSSSGSGGKPSS